MTFPDPASTSTFLNDATHDLARRCLHALSGDPTRPAIEFKRQWLSWGELQRVADQLNALIDASGLRAGDTIAFVPRNRPSAIAALLGMISRQHSIQMIYAFQSLIVIANDIERLNP